MALTDNIISYYKMEANSNDSASTNNGTDTSITYSSGAGKIGQGAATTNGLITNTSASFKIDTMSVSLWVKSSAFGASFRLLCASELKWSFFCVDNILGSYDWGASVFRTTSVNIADGNWHHCVLTYASGVANGSKIYIDGALSLTFTITSGAGSTDLKMFSSAVSSQNADCSMDEAGIWSRLLTSTEVTQLYNSGAGLQYPFTAAANTSNFFF